MLNRPYQNDRSDRGIISCFDSKLYFTLVIISQKSIFKVTPSFCFSFVNVFILQKQLLLYISYISLIFLYITNIAMGGGGGGGDDDGGDGGGGGGRIL